MLVCLALVRGHASAAMVTFGPGSLIIPMDTGNPGFDDGQDDEMMRAYGLVYALLRNHVPVHWTIDPAKPANGDDFTIPSAGFSVQSVRDGTVVPLPRAYRGGPFIIAAADAAAALPIIDAWQATAGDETEVHEVVTGSFTPTDVPRTLLRAPRIAVLVDGNEQIAFNNLNAAGILDSTGGSWGYTSPDLLTESQLVGATTSSTADGALFNLPSGLPRHCHLISMHYNTTALTTDVVSEVRSWLGHGPLTHAFMQCEAAVVFESNANGNFLTTAGIQDDGGAATSPINQFPSDPLSQIDGSFTVDSGAVDSIGLKVGSVFKTGVRTLFNESMTPLTERITMLTGRMDGTVPAVRGRVTYLGGHDYSLSMPVSSNPQTNGVRLMLNTLFESDCATDADPVPQADVVLTKSAPALITGNQINYTITYSNPGPRPVENLKLTDVLPAGTAYVDGSGVPAPTSTAGGILIWNLPALASGASANVTFAVSVTTDGTYVNDAELSFSHLTVRTISSNTVITVRDTTAPDVVIVSGPAGPTNDATPTFVFDNADNTATVMECGIDGDFDPCSEGLPGFTAAPLGSGPHTFTARVSDAAGNTASASRSFTVDVDPPHVDFVDPNPIYTQLVRPTFNFATFGGGVITTECLVTPTAPPRSFVPCAPPSWQVPLPDLPDGSYQVQIVPTDEAGNVGALATHAFMVDTVAPVVNLSPANPSVTSDNTPAFSWTITPAGGSPVTSECRIDAGAWEPCTGAFVVPSALTDGFHTLQVKAEDAAGNQGVIASHQFLVDTVAPVVTIPGPPSNQAVTDDPFPSFVFAISSGGSPVHAQCRIVTLAPPSATAYYPCDFLTFTYGPDIDPDGLADGNYVFEVLATDEAGNVGTADNPFAFTVDSIGPIVTIFAPPSNDLYTSDTTPDFGFSVSDGGSPTSVDCRVTNITPGPTTDTGFVPCASRWTVPVVGGLSDGKYHLTVRATDAVPLVGADTFDFIVDTTAPVVDIPGPPQNPTVTNNRHPSFVFTVSNGASPDHAPVHSQCRIAQGASATPYFPCDQSFAYTPGIDLDGLPDGSYEFQVLATDEVGNTGSDSHSFIVDTTQTSLCSGGPFICKAPGLTTFTLRNRANDERDSLKLTLSRGDATTPGEVGDPTVDTEYAVCVWDDVGGVPSLVMEMAAPAGGNCVGRPCWRSISGGGFRYKDPGLLPHGLRKMTVRPGSLGDSSIKVNGKGIVLPDPPMPFQQDPSITVQVVNSAGSCWGAEYVSAPRVNSGEKLIVKEKP